MFSLNEEKLGENLRNVFVCTYYVVLRQDKLPYTDLIKLQHQLRMHVLIIDNNQLPNNLKGTSLIPQTIASHSVGQDRFALDQLFRSFQSWFYFTNVSHRNIPPLARNFHFFAVNRRPLVAFVISS